MHLCSYAVFSGPLPGALGLAAAQSALGHDVWFGYDRYRGDFSPYEEVFDESARPLPGHGALPGPVFLAPKGGARRFLTDIVRLRRFLSGENIDVVHAHLTHDHWLAKWSRPKGAALIRTLHSERASQARLGTTQLFAGTEHFILRRENQRTSLAARLRASPSASSTKISGGVSLEHWSRTPSSRKAEGGPVPSHRMRQALGVAADELLLVHVGLMADRGQRELLFAANDLHLRCKTKRRVHVALVGLGPDRDALEELARQMPAAAHIHFVGYLEADALRSLYEAADGAFVATVGNDGAARAALEAMAMELPVVCPHPSLVTDAVHELDETVGYLAASRTPAGLAQALIRWRDDPMRSKKGRAGAQAVRAGRSFATEAQQTLTAYKQALAIRSEPR